MILMEGRFATGVRYRPRRWYRPHTARPARRLPRRLRFSLARSTVHPHRLRHWVRTGETWARTYEVTPRRHLEPVYEITTYSEAVSSLDSRPGDIYPQLLRAIEADARQEYMVEQGMLHGLRGQRARRTPPPQWLLNRYRSQWERIRQRERTLIGQHAATLARLEEALREYREFAEKFNAASPEERNRMRGELARIRNWVGKLTREYQQEAAEIGRLGYQRHQYEVAWRYWDPEWKDAIPDWEERTKAGLEQAKEILEKVRRAMRGH